MKSTKKFILLSKTKETVADTKLVRRQTTQGRNFFSASSNRTHSIREISFIDSIQKQTPYDRFVDSHVVQPWILGHRPCSTIFMRYDGIQRTHGCITNKTRQNNHTTLQSNNTHNIFCTTFSAQRRRVMLDKSRHIQWFCPRRARSFPSMASGGWPPSILRVSHQSRKEPLSGSRVVRPWILEDRPVVVCAYT